ncbi:MAG: hypothetical protein JWR15_968, partial [Prosthecobacter sp.]|nr:hypothetical protein [Prosthecobacter sp.]
TGGMVVSEGRGVLRPKLSQVATGRGSAWSWICPSICCGNFRTDFYRRFAPRKPAAARFGMVYEMGTSRGRGTYEFEETIPADVLLCTHAGSVFNCVDEFSYHLK